MSLVADVLETASKKSSRKVKVGAAPLVRGERNKHKASPPVRGKKALLEAYGLESVKASDIEPGASLLHVVRNQANVKGRTSKHYRPAFHPCTVVGLTPNRVRVRFANGMEKAVKLDSLYRPKEKL